METPLIKKLFIALFLASSCFADQAAISNFKYLNTNENSTIIDPNSAQDLLNVDITPGGKSVKKRSGYGLYKNVFSTSSGVHGGYHFFDSSGNDIQIWGSSVSVKGIVADGAPATIVSSMTVNSTIDCADSQGSAYCVDSNRDFYIKTNGATLTNWYTSPLGTMVESTPDRIVVAGVAASPNTLFFSQSNAFTNYTVGPLTTDAFTEVIAAPGSHLTHIRWGCQKILWWKDQSFGYFDFDDQYSAQVKIVSDNVGTFDNTSAIDPGGTVWFRGQDGHTYKYDCSSLERMTIDITPQIQTSGKRTTNLWQQTSQADWQSGAIIPTGYLSTTLSVGDVVSSSFSKSEFSSASGWGSGTSSNFAIGTSSISLLTNNSGTVTDSGFETNPISTNWTVSGTASSVTTDVGTNCTMSPDSGSRFGIIQSSGTTVTINAVATDTGLEISTTTFVGTTNSCTWTSRTLSSTGYIGRRIKLKLSIGSVSTPRISSVITKDSYIFGGDITFKTAFDQIGGAICPGGVCTYNVGLDTIASGSSTITSGAFTSQLYDMGLASTTWQITDLNFTANTSTPSFSLITATATTGPWTQVITSSQTNSLSNRYAKFTSTITVGSADNALTYISSFTIVARSSGTLYSAWKNAPNWSAWGTFNPTSQDNGGSHTFYVRASSSPQTVLNSTVTWVAQSANAQVATSTAGIYFQIRDDFTVPAATNTPTLNDFTVNWFEGSASDQAYMLFFENAIWETVAYGTGVSSNTYVFRHDLINQGWTLYNFGAGGMLIQGNKLYFGSVGDGNVFQYGSGVSDNGAAINAFWKSKDFTAVDPFMQSSLVQIDIFGKQNSGQSITSTYTMDTSTVTSYTVSLSSPSQTYIQSRKLLPSGKTGYTFNLKISDTSATSAWEIFGFRIVYNTLPWKPTQ